MSLNYKQSRLLARSWTESEKEESRRMPFIWAIMVGIAILLVMLIVDMASASEASTAKYSDNMAILAIIGEAESEPYAGMVAVGRTIIKRGSLKGVYGLTARRVVMRKYSSSTYKRARQALEEAKRTMHGWKAIGWGNESDLAIFNRSAWFTRCTIVAHIGNHYFYGVK